MNTVSSPLIAALMEASASRLLMDIAEPGSIARPALPLWLLIIAVGWPLIPCLFLLFWRWPLQRRLKIFSILAVVLTVLSSYRLPGIATILLLLGGFLSGFGFNTPFSGRYGYGYNNFNSTQTIVGIAIAIVFPMLFTWLFARTIYRAPRMTKGPLLFALGVFVVVLSIAIRGLMPL